jgi:opacity protein-like surface antigen
MRPYVLALTILAATTSPALAQSHTATAPPAAAAQGARRPQAPASRAARPADGWALRGYGMAGGHWFTASSTFTAVTGSGSTPVFGGGLRLNIPRGPYLDVGAWRYEQDGERVFVAANREVFRLGIPTTISMVPLEVTAGWRFPNLIGRLTPHIGAGVTSLKYEETSDFADAAENVSDRYTGYHVVGGVEVRLHRWVGAAAEFSWTSIAEGLGDAGASKAFDEDNLGGKSVRLKIFIGR